MTISKAVRTRLRSIFTLILMGGVGLLATGCGSTSNTSTATTIPIRVWRINQGVDPIRDQINQFQKDHSTVQITYTNNTSLSGYEVKFLKSLASLQGPEILSIPNDWLGDYYQQLNPLPSDYFYATGSTTGPSPAEEVKKLYPPGISEQLIMGDGNVYGLPTNVDSLRLYYNPDLFDAALTDYRHSLGDSYTDEQYQPVRQLLRQAPATWTDLLQQTKYLTKKSGDTITRSAIAFGTADNVPNAQDVVEALILQNGARIISTDHKNALFQVPQTTPSGAQVKPGENAVDFFTSFANPKRDNYTWNPSMPPALDAFAKGQVAMVIAYSDFGEALKVKYPTFHTEVTSLPQIALPTVQAPVNFIKFDVETVTKTAQNSAAAFAFLGTYTDEISAKTLAQEVKRTSPYTATLQKYSDDYNSSQVFTGATTYKIDHPDFDNVFHQMIVDVSQNSVPVSSAVADAAQKINNLLTPPPTP